jgi:WhiB family redox-sensing transcriptional regulator
VTCLDDIIIDTRDRSFMTDGACRGLPYGWMFPDHWATALERKAICATCPVVDACREYGLDEHHGVWGGLTERERNDLRLSGSPSDGIKHGTLYGWRQHRAKNIVPCQACTQAKDAYQARRRRGGQVEQVDYCGTAYGYHRHRRVLGDSACEACMTAHAEYERNRVRNRAGAA